MSEATTPPLRPITLVSHIGGLHLRIKPGSAEQIPGTNRFTMKQGKWFFFERGRYVLSDIDAVTIFGGREEAIKALRSHVRFGRDFQIAPDAPAKSKNTSGKAPKDYSLAPGATS